MVERLLEVGKWLKHSGECVYNTHFWSRGAEAGSARFLTTPTAFCAVLLAKPKDGLVTIDRILPIREGDEVQLLGVPPKAGGLNWWVDAKKGVTLIKVKPTDVEAVKHAWAFKISYGGVSG